MGLTLLIAAALNLCRRLTNDTVGFETKPSLLLFTLVILYDGYIRVDADERGKRLWIIRTLGYWTF